MSEVPESEDSSLPPLKMCKMPEGVRTWSARVRWALAMGWEVKEIANTWGLRYQMVRNVKVTEPKRAAREDMPPLKWELLNPVDDVQAIMDAELDRSLAAGRFKNPKGQPPKMGNGQTKRFNTIPELMVDLASDEEFDMDQLDPDEIEQIKNGG